VSASFDRGVLEIRIPKPETQKPRRISIAANGGQEAIEGHEATSTT
jgi:HSP20 family protein